MPAMLVVSRIDGSSLTPSDLAALAVSPPLISADGRAAVAPIPVAAASGAELNKAVAAARTSTAARLPAGVAAELTGVPAFGADIGNAMSNANITLLVVTASVVAVLLVVTYRSPVLWLVPLAVIGFADGLSTAVGTVVSRVTGLTFDGATAGITSVLVFGAGTNYALLLISRYREELSGARRSSRSVENRGQPRGACRHRQQCDRRAGTGDACLRCSARHRQPRGSCGVRTGDRGLLVLLVMPPLLSLFGTRLFWPFIPHRGVPTAVTAGAWHRIATWVTRHAGRVAATSILVLGAMAVGLLATPIGLSQTEQFRVKAESVSGYETLSTHFPSGMTDPTIVIGDSARAAVVAQAIAATPGCHLIERGRIVGVRADSMDGDSRRLRHRWLLSKPLPRCVNR